MRISLTLGDDLLDALRARSDAEGRPVEAVLADAVRRGLSGPAPLSPAEHIQDEIDVEDARHAAGFPEREVRNGIRLFPVRPGTPPVTPELIQRLMDETE